MIALSSKHSYVHNIFFYKTNSDQWRRRGRVRGLRTLTLLTRNGMKWWRKCCLLSWVDEPLITVWNPPVHVELNRSKYVWRNIERKYRIIATMTAKRRYGHQKNLRRQSHKNFLDTPLTLVTWQSKLRLL